MQSTGLEDLPLAEPCATSRYESRTLAHHVEVVAEEQLGVCRIRDDDEGLEDEVVHAGVDAAPELGEDWRHCGDPLKRPVLGCSSRGPRNFAQRMRESISSRHIR